MNRIRTALAVLFTLAACAAAQEVHGTRYVVRSQGGEADARALALEMDRRFELYNALFRFDPARLETKLNVRSFSRKADFDAYLTEALGNTRSGASYLHYSRPDKSELVVLRDAAGVPVVPGVFSHQAFIQFLRAFVPQPPVWMREGFAIVFEPLTYYRARDAFEFEENLAWLETVKGWGESAPSIVSVLAADTSIASDRVQPAAWALTSFILNSEDENYRRFLYESFLLLDPAASAEQNAQTVAERAALWIDAEQAALDYAAYLKSRRTFAELIEDGRAAYTAKDAAAAEAAFAEASSLKPTHYAPHYYLGLIAYEKKEYARAENHYRSALQFGADEALCSYALGVNAAADGRNADARAFLERAKKASPDRYAARVDELLARLK